MQQSPNRERMNFTQYSTRPVRVHLGTSYKVERSKRPRIRKCIKFVQINACNCCTMRDGNHRQWQTRMSKVKTLRTHRDGSIGKDGFKKDIPAINC